MCVSITRFAACCCCCCRRCCCFCCCVPVRWRRSGRVWPMAKFGTARLPRQTFPFARPDNAPPGPVTSASRARVGLGSVPGQSRVKKCWPFGSHRGRAPSSWKPGSGQLTGCHPSQGVGLALAAVSRGADSVGCGRACQRVAGTQRFLLPVAVFFSSPSVGACVIVCRRVGATCRRRLRLILARRLRTNTHTGVEKLGALCCVTITDKRCRAAGADDVVRRRDGVVSSRRRRRRPARRRGHSGRVRDGAQGGAAPPPPPPPPLEHVAAHGRL